MRAKGYVCVPGWSLSSRLCAHFLPFVLGTDKQGVGRIASLLCACGGSGSGCPPRIYLRRLCAVSLPFCVLIRTSAPCERLSSVCNDAATIGYPVAAAKTSLRLHVPKTMIIHARSMRSVDSVSCTLIHFSLLFTGKLSHLVQLDVVGITLRSIIKSHSTNLVLGLEQCLGGLLVD